jgi:hypothetical protein
MTSNLFSLINEIKSSTFSALDKSIFVTIDNENGTYYIKNIGTGI